MEAVLAENPRKTSGVWEQAGVYSGLGFVLFGGIAGGYLLGAWLDGLAGTRILFSMILAAMGFGGALYEILRILDRFEKRSRGNDNSNQPPSV